MIPVKSPGELEMMRKAGETLKKIIDELRSRIKIGMATREIDTIAEELIKEEGVVSAFKGYRGFPANICTSINEEVVHGIPSERRLEGGDILKLDLGIKQDGFFSDSAFTMILGKVDGRTRSLVAATKKALELGIAEARRNNHLSDISWTIQNYIEAQGFSVVRDFVGHGIGQDMHEEPEVPNFGLPNSGPLLREGMVLAIEPMVNMGTWEVRISENNWTAITKDNLNSAHFEHTVAITASGPEVLTA